MWPFSYQVEAYLCGAKVATLCDDRASSLAQLSSKVADAEGGVEGV